MFLIKKACIFSIILIYILQSDIYINALKNHTSMTQENTILGPNAETSHSTLALKRCTHIYIQSLKEICPFFEVKKEGQ